MCCSPYNNKSRFMHNVEISSGAGFGGCFSAAIEDRRVDVDGGSDVAAYGT